MLQPSAPAVPEPDRGLRLSDVEWLQAFYPWLHQHPDWWIEFRFLEDRSDGVKNPPVAVRFLRDAVEIAAGLRAHRALAAERAAQVQAGGDGPWPAGLFWGVQPRVTRRGGRDHVAAFVALACSLDCDDRLEWPGKHRARVLWEALHRCPLVPSVVVWNGDGFDAWWLLREPLFDRRRGEEVQQAIAGCLQSRPADAAGLCRWPNTVNYRGLPGGRPRAVRVVGWRPRERYAFQTLLECFLPYLPAPRPHSACDVSTTVWRRFQQVLAEDESLGSLWKQRCPNGTTQDRHTLNLSLAAALVERGFGAHDFETLAALAPWNAEHASMPAELSRAWDEARGEERIVTAAPVAQPSPVAPAVHALPGLLLDALPESAWTDWARLYRDAVGASTEAADEFHYLALVTVLGTAFGRSVVLHCGRPVYLNAYAILVGPTGDRKSTAAQLALDLLARVAPQALLLNGVGSQEGLMERMACAESSGGRTLWYVDEMASLLKKARRESSGGLIEFITEIFHCPDFKTHATRSKSIHLQSPTLSILAGSTPTWLEAALQQDDILGGFANRFVYVTGHAKPDNAMPSRPDPQAMERLVAWTKQAMLAPAREIGWSPQAREAWNCFYVEWRRSVAGCSEQVSALLRRIDLYVLKFAVLAAVMDGVAEISQTHLTAAVALGRYLAGCACRLLGDLGAPNDYRLETLIEQKLQDADGQMTRKQLRQAIGGRVSGEKLDRVLTGMERNGLIHQKIDASCRTPSRLVRLI